MQELLELSEAEIQARVTARKPAAKLTKAVQHLQRTWLQVLVIKYAAQLAVGLLIMHRMQRSIVKGIVKHSVIIWSHVGHASRTTAIVLIR